MVSVYLCFGVALLAGAMLIATMRAIAAIAPPRAQTKGEGSRLQIWAAQCNFTQWLAEYRAWERQFGRQHLRLIRRAIVLGFVVSGTSSVGAFLLLLRLSGRGG